MHISLLKVKKDLKLNVNVAVCIMLICALFFPIRGDIIGISALIWMMGTMCIFAGILLFYKFDLRSLLLPKGWLFYFFNLLVVNLYWLSPNVPLGTYLRNILPFVASVLILGNMIRRRDTFDTILDAIMLIFTVYAVLCIAEAIFHFNVFDVLTGTQVEYTFANEIRFGFARSRGAADLSINNGLLLSMVLSIAAFRMYNRNRMMDRVCYIMILVAIILTVSRTAYVHAVLSQFLIFMSVSVKKQAKMICIIVFAALASLILILPLGSDLWENVLEMFEQTISSFIDILFGTKNSSMIDAGHRFVLWEWVFYHLRNNLMWGLGLEGGFVVISATGYVKESVEVHWLAVMYQYGIVGLMGFVVYQISCLRMTIKQWRHDPPCRRIANFNYIMTCNSVGYFVALFAVGGGEDVTMYYMLMALTLAYNRIQSRSTNTQLTKS